ncbi:MAG: hypothetical protein IPK66_04630 [Rhodospirillales bacterium]|nr:hypothetical protein [Rhodospirillales bacterium]
MNRNRILGYTFVAAFLSISIVGAGEIIFHSLSQLEDRLVSVRNERITQVQEARIIMRGVDAKLDEIVSKLSKVEGMVSQESDEYVNCNKQKHMNNNSEIPAGSGAK